MNTRTVTTHKQFKIKIQTVYLLFLLPILLLITIGMGIKIHRGMYRNIEEGFDKKLAATSLVVSAFIDGGEPQQSLLLKHIVLGMTYVDSRSTFYAIDRSTNSLVTVDPDHGGLNRIHSLDTHHLTDLAYDPIQNHLYGIAPNEGLLHSIDLELGQLTPIDLPLPSSNSIAGLAYHPGEQCFYAWIADQLIRIDSIEHSVGLIGKTSNRTITGLTYDPKHKSILAMDNLNKEILMINTNDASTDIIGNLNFIPNNHSENPNDESSSDSLVETNSVSAPERAYWTKWRALEYDRIQQTGNPNTIRHAWEHVKKMAYDAVSAAQPEAEDHQSVPDIQRITLRGLAWSSATQKFYSSADRLIEIDPVAWTCMEKGWWANYWNELSDDYLQSILPMRRIQEKLNLTYLYTFQQDIAKDRQTIQYILDANYDENHSFIGDTDTLPSGVGYDIFGRVYSGAPYTSDVVHWQEWGLLKTGYAPIYNQNDRIASVVGTDIDVSILESKTRLATLKTVLIGTLAFAIALIVTYLITWRLLKPINRLKENALVVAAGGYGEETPIEGPSEWRSLCTAFNQLSHTLKVFFEERMHANLTLRLRSTQQELLRVLRQESLSALMLNKTHGISFTVNTEPNTIDISGTNQERERMLLWAGRHRGTPLEAAKIQREISTLARLFLGRYKENWDRIIEQFSRAYPDTISHILAIDRERRQLLGHGSHQLTCLSIENAVFRLEDLPDGQFIPLPDRPWILIGESQFILRLSQAIEPTRFSDCWERQLPDFQHQIADFIAACDWTGLERSGFITAIEFIES